MAGSDSAPPGSVTRSSFEFIRSLLRQRSAIELADDKQYLVDTRLRAVARAHGLSGPEEVVGKVRGAPSGDLSQAVVEALTTNETYFFRDPVAFRALRNEGLPRLFEHNREERTLRVWSAACSTGQEPYSLAILLQEAQPRGQHWSFEIVATDINESALARARKGAYRQDEVNRGLPALYLTRYFQRQGARWKVASSIQAQVDFLQRNLAEPWGNHGPFDLVLMRNVLIYFSPQTKRDILARASQLLGSHGLLMLGGGESPLGTGLSLVRVCSGIYRLGETSSEVA